MNLNILLIIIGVLLMVLAIYLVPKWQTRKIKNIQPEKKWEAENEFRKTLIQVFGGLVVILSLLFTWGEMTQSQRNIEKGHHITRFSQAISFLGANNADQKIGGIYTLEQIAKESPEEYLGTVIEVLSAFVRNAEVNEIKEGAKNLEEKKEVKLKIKPETQIAMTVLGRIRTKDNKDHWENLPRINLVNAKLIGANLMEANLLEADLKGTDLRGANLRDVNLRDANLGDANLAGATFTEAYLTRTDFTRADLTGANLRKAYLWDAYLTGAYLTGADLMRADFTRADLTGADLREAKQLEVEQLLKAETLFKVIGLNPEMKKELKELRPELFESPMR